MKPRIRMQIVADGEDTAPLAAAAQGRFHALLIVEDIETGDDRIFTEGAVTWRNLPLPLMGTDESDHGALVVNPTVLLGNIDKIERQGTEIHGWGAWLTEPDEDASKLIGLVQRGELRGISVDVDAVEFELLVPSGDDMGLMLFAEEDAPEDAPPKEVGDDGVEREVLPMPAMKMRVTEGRVMGATVVPFPAFQEAFIEPDDGTEPALAASAARTFARYGVTGAMIASLVTDEQPEAPSARFSFPAIPPREWFDVPETPGPMPLTILDSGQVFGHLALWGECHVGIAGDCVEPPPSPSGYARFHVGEIPVDDGGRVAIGRLTYRTGHADLKRNAEATRSHYDNSGTVAADICASDGEYGIWVCGAARPGLSDLQVREIMASPPSGDWRRFGRELEMVGALCVNVPGFNTPRAQVRKENGLVASLIVSNPAPFAVRFQTSGMDPVVARRAIERIAATVGRGRADRIAALTARVHGGS